MYRFVDMLLASRQAMFCYRRTCIIRYRFLTESAKEFALAFLRLHHQCSGTLMFNSPFHKSITLKFHSFREVSILFLDQVASYYLLELAFICSLFSK